MKWIDYLFGWVMVALGIVACAFTFRAHGFSSLGAQMGKSVGLMRLAAIFANLVVLIPAISNTVTLRAVLRQNPQVPLLAIAAFIELLFSFSS